METKNAYQKISNGELAKLLADKREALRALRFSAAGSRPKDSSEPAKLRKEIARIMTEFSARAITDKQHRVSETILDAADEAHIHTTT
ncbi:MAG: 50S ribosomal protein L29 [Parcubacteria group bacterium 21-54-25]|nr:MAG: 50S ribosomal protein L29 [Parcubacteria group bacterium 21-54-25]HQU08261.1 50S ribosomal protein L29 [Candidatus Paceibacterota bacterium]